MTPLRVKKKVLFICNRNAARSQMAEGLLKSLYGEFYDVYSSGSKPSTINPYAIKVMAEIGIDISDHRSKSLKEFEGVAFDYVVTVCGGEEKTCSFFPGGKTYLHESFEDPTTVNGTDDEKTDAFRRIRNEIKDWIKETFAGF